MCLAYIWVNTYSQMKYAVYIYINFINIGLIYYILIDLSKDWCWSGFAGFCQLHFPDESYAVSCLHFWAMP